MDIFEKWLRMNIFSPLNNGNDFLKINFNIFPNKTVFKSNIV